MKINRLIAITMYLLSHETVSASTLAARFEVSRRTIQRDVDAINQAGIPIVSTYGVEGGYRIMDGFRLSKQVVDVEDYLNIIIALRGLRSAYDNDRINATLDKAAALLRDSDQRIFVDFAVARERAEVNKHLPVIEKAIHARMPLRIGYTNARGEETQRTVEPLALSFRWYAWYLFAYCTHRQGYRLFKLPRISGCEPAGGTFSKEHGNVEGLMKTAMEPDGRKQYRVKLLCKKEARQQALEYLGANIVQEHENGDFVMELCVPLERMWFSLLLGFGDQVEVLEPDEVKAMLREKAQEVLSVYPS